MDIASDFKGFLVPFGFTFEGYSRESPIETACLLLLQYTGRGVDIGCEVYPVGLRESSVCIPENSVQDLFAGIDRSLCDYVWIDVPNEGFYVIQRIVFGREFISQIEKRIPA